MKALIALVVLVLVGAGVWYVMQTAPATTTNTTTTNNYDTNTSPTGAMMDYVSPIPSVATTGTMTASPAVTGSLTNSMAVNLGELNSSGQSGTATLTETNGKVTVKIVLTGAPTGSDQPAHIHVGKCPDVGSVKYPLNNVKNGQSTTTINASLAQLQSELPLGLNVHKSAAEVTVYTACGDLGL